MSSLDFEFDFDTRVTALEVEWRRAFEASIAARADYHKLAADSRSQVDALSRAREAIDQTETLKRQIMIKIERLERRMARRG